MTPSNHFILTSKTILSLLIGLLLLPPAPRAIAEEGGELGPLVYVVPIEGEINKSLPFLMRRAVKEAISNQADHLVLHMDTPGGDAYITSEILEILQEFPQQENTHTFIDKWAISAGAFISAGTRNITMAPGSVIGAATPIMMTQEGPQKADEKFNSAFRAIIRSAAERHAHNVDVFNAMVDEDQGLTVSGTEIVPKGKIVTLTTEEAIRKLGSPPKPLLSQGKYENLDVMISETISPNAEIRKVEPTGFEEIARLIVLISPLLIPGALLLGYIEFKTPGFGVFGVGAIILALFFFFGHYIAGLTGHGLFVVFLLGVTLIAVELFLLQGTILPGVLGFTLVLGSLLYAMVDTYPAADGSITLPTLGSFEEPLFKMAISLCLTFLGFWVLARVLPRTPMYAHLILNETIEAQTPIEASAHRAGEEGTTLSPLRPAGTADFGNGPEDVVTSGDFIGKGQQVRIVEVEGNRIVVDTV